MKVKAVVLLCCIVFAFQSAKGQGLHRKFFKKANQFFKEYVKEGAVNYESIRSDPFRLNELGIFISNADLSHASEARIKSFYINAYNILLIKNVLNYYPVRYPLEEAGFFSQTRHAIAGDTLTLNEIENNKLLNNFKDFKILFALSSASKGAVPLTDFAFKPRKINRQLKKVIKATVNDYDYVRVMSRSSKVLLAESFLKIKTDFNSREMIDLLNEYMKEPIPAEFTIDIYPVNRNLNSKN